MRVGEGVSTRCTGSVTLQVLQMLTFDSLHHRLPPLPRMRDVAALPRTPARGAPCCSPPHLARLAFVIFLGSCENQLLYVRLGVRLFYEARG